MEFRNRSYDYVVDVAWSSINPTLFATITSGCELALWNLTRSSEDAACTFKVANPNPSPNPNPNSNPNPTFRPIS